MKLTLSKVLLVMVLGSAAAIVLVAAQSAQSAPPAPAMSAVDVVDHVQKFYASVNQVTATFRQTVHNAQFGRDSTSSGTVWIMKPGKMRWDYVEKKDGVDRPKKSFISNGTTLYDVEHGNKQVMQMTLQGNVMPAAVSFLYGNGALKSQFDAQLDPNAGYGEKSDIVLKLTPKQPSAQYKNLYLVIDPDDFHAKESIVIDSSNNVNHFQFDETDFHKPIKQSLFDFDPRSVPDYKIIQ